MRLNRWSLVALVCVALLTGCAGKTIRPVHDVPAPRVSEPQHKSEMKAAYQAIALDKNLPATRIKSTW